MHLCVNCQSVPEGYGLEEAWNNYNPIPEAPPMKKAKTGKTDKEKNVEKTFSHALHEFLVPSVTTDALAKFLQGYSKPINKLIAALDGPRITRSAPSFDYRQLLTYYVILTSDYSPAANYRLKSVERYVDPVQSTAEPWMVGHMAAWVSVGGALDTLQSRTEIVQQATDVKTDFILEDKQTRILADITKIRGTLEKLSNSRPQPGTASTVPLELFHSVLLIVNRLQLMHKVKVEYMESRLNTQQRETAQTVNSVFDRFKYQLVRILSTPYSGDPNPNHSTGPPQTHNWEWDTERGWMDTVKDTMKGAILGTASVLALSTLPSSTSRGDELTAGHLGSNNSISNNIWGPTTTTVGSNILPGLQDTNTRSDLMTALDDSLRRKPDSELWTEARTAYNASPRREESMYKNRFRARYNNLFTLLLQTDEPWVTHTSRSATKWEESEWHVQRFFIARIDKIYPPHGATTTEDLQVLRNILQLLFESGESTELRDVGWNPRFDARPSDCDSILQPHLVSMFRGFIEFVSNPEPDRRAALDANIDLMPPDMAYAEYVSLPWLELWNTVPAEQLYNRLVRKPPPEDYLAKYRDTIWGGVILSAMAALSQSGR